MRVASAPSAVWTIIEGARSWRIARDAGEPVQESLYKRLETLGAGLLAPVLDSLMTLFEARFGRRFQAGGPSDVAFTRDELHLLDMLEDDDAAPPAEPFQPNLAMMMRIALRSMRIMLLSVASEAASVVMPFPQPPRPA
ncbi:MAG: hypothetical protein V4564_10630 [Pseudomonadota bacterium]|uniref:hypothetical protein n=1 Tax=Sphingomonas sp. ERG5 TaxID=1381597 RepID=UPI00054B6A93|nr:hypothetical protein [Sphingomonas sp. ERG5]